MKKSASKAPKTPAKAKPAPAASKTTAQTKPAAALAPKTKKPVAAAPAVVEKPKPAAIPVVKAPASDAMPATVISAQVDVGFGNTLYVRGEGAGLSWDKGIQMENLAADRWQIALQGATAPVVFKFLINDETWSLGEDYAVSAGCSLALAPIF